MKLYIYNFTICSALVLCVDAVCNVRRFAYEPPAIHPDYYWRDYVGIIPPDAIPGGTDKSGHPTYIGQAYIQKFEVLPVTIYEGCNSVRTSAYGKEMFTENNVKILCGKDLHEYSWISTKNEETHLLTNCHLVVGGSEVGATLNIGRVNHNGETIIGKVFPNPLSNRGLWIPSNGEEARYLSYEILTFGCNNKLD